MARKSHKPEDIFAKLRQVEVLTSQGRSVAVGVLLVFTLMVGPSAAAQRFTRHVRVGVALAADGGLGRSDAWLLHRLANEFIMR
jgi:hypothetical protein